MLLPLFSIATINHAPPYVGERGNHLCLAQKHAKNTSCILSTAFARPSYALQLSSHGVTGADGGKMMKVLEAESAAGIKTHYPA